MAQQTLFPSSARGWLRVPYRSVALVIPGLIDFNISPGQGQTSEIDLKGPSVLAPTIQIAGDATPGEITFQALATSSAAQVRLMQMAAANTEVTGWEFVSEAVAVLATGGTTDTLAKAAETASVAPVFTRGGTDAKKVTDGTIGPGAFILMGGAINTATPVDGRTVWAVDALLTDTTFRGYYVGAVADAEVEPVSLASYDATAPAFWTQIAASGDWASIKPAFRASFNGTVSLLSEEAGTTQDNRSVTITPSQAVARSFYVGTSKNPDWLS